MKTNYRTAGKGRTNQVICLRSHAARFFLSHEIERIFGFPPGYTKIPAARFAAIKAGRRGAAGGKTGTGKGREIGRAVFDGVREVREEGEVREEEGEDAEEVREMGEVRGVREVSACISRGYEGGKRGAEGLGVVGRDGRKWVLGVEAKACGERRIHKGGEVRRWVEGKMNGGANRERERGGGKRRRVWKGRDGGELQGAARCDAVRSGDCADADGDEGDDVFTGYHGGAAVNGASGLNRDNAVKSGDVGVLKGDNAVENGHATDHEDNDDNDDVVEVRRGVQQWAQETRGRRSGGGERASGREKGEEASAGKERGHEELQERDRWGLLGNSFPVAVISYLLTPLLSPSLRLSAPPCALPAFVPPHVARAKCALMVPGEVWAAYSWSKLPNWYALILSVEGGRFDTESLRKPAPLCIT
ncbi:unnamed protein product [Closterium sp. Yama58-4]|nr:unnamed protein product [Closterium sp. Yama58-4]